MVDFSPMGENHLISARGLTTLQNPLVTGNHLPHTFENHASWARGYMPTCRILIIIENHLLGALRTARKYHRLQANTVAIREPPIDNARAAACLSHLATSGSAGELPANVAHCPLS